MKFSKIILISLLTFSPYLILAQPVTEPEIIQAEIDWIAELVKGGSTAVALIFLLLAGITFTVERLLALRRCYIAPHGLANTVKPLWKSNSFDAIIKECEAKPSTLGRMIEYLTRHRKADPALLIPGAQDIAARELRAHSHKAFALAVVAALAPLLGLLGTMIGMIESFKLVEIYGDEGGASMLAGSISKALITTAIGLIIAIPTLGIYHVVKYRLNCLSDLLEEELEALLNAWLLTDEVSETSDNETK